MIYELAKQLKDAGFPQREGDWYTSDGQWIPEEERQYIPTLSELINAVIKMDYFIKLGGKVNFWATAHTREDYAVESALSGSTPEEAVAQLWLALNNK